MQEILPDTSKIEQFIDNYVNKSIEADINNMMNLANSTLNETIRSAMEYAEMEIDRITWYIIGE